MRKKYYCFNCGEEMIFDQGTLVCFGCGRTWQPKERDDDDDFTCSSGSYPDYDRESEWEKEEKLLRRRELGEWNKDNDPDFYQHCEDGWDDWEF